ncbi:MAG: hypothetical protein EPN20_09475 [Magnetospirillum sp.]|nr:MAG: hypothetical protein EPN20_09475 [Magnetospirillum sp.]
MRRPAKSPDKGLSRPPFRLAEAADDARQMWVLDRHTWDGRYVRVGTLVQLEPHFAFPFGASLPPDEKAFLFPISTTSEAILYKRLERYGKTRFGWERPDG